MMRWDRSRAPRALLLQGGQEPEPHPTGAEPQPEPQPRALQEPYVPRRRCCRSPAALSAAPPRTACICARPAPHRPAHAHGLKASSTAVRHAAAALHPPRPAPAACQLPRLLVCRSHSCAGGWLAPQVWPPACHHCADCRHAQHLPALLLVCSSSRQRCRQAASDGGPANFVRIAVQRRFLSLAALFCCPHGLPASTH